MPLTKRLREEVFFATVVERLKRSGNPKFKRSVAGYPLPYTYQTEQARLQVLCDVACVPHRDYHCFRHTKATELLARGVPIQAVSPLLGHADVAATDGLYHHATTLDYARYPD